MGLDPRSGFSIEKVLWFFTLLANLCVLFFLFFIIIALNLVFAFFICVNFFLMGNKDSLPQEIEVQQE